MSKMSSLKGHSSRIQLMSASHADFDENYIRREKRRRVETRAELTRMRAQLPQYTIQDIRQFRLPFHEALILELEETGFISTKSYIMQLFKLNEKLRDEAGGIKSMDRPLLMNSDKELKTLSSALKKAEIANTEGNHRKQIEILLAVAIDFAFESLDWVWLAEDILLQCISSAHEHATGGKHEAISRYMYAKMLIEKVKEFEAAEEELKIVREISMGKSWNLKAFFPSEYNSSTIFMNTNYLLHLCYMRQARAMLKIDEHKALEFATLAKKRANEACYHDGETMALFIKGQCELHLGDTKDAVSTFNKAYYVQLKLKSDKGMCEARVELSKAYLMHGSTRLALNTLMALKESAEKLGFKFYLAQAYRYLGEYYLTSGEPHRATPLLSDALTIFHESGNMAEADQVRNLGALSSGLELMPVYIGLLQRNDRRYEDWYENLMKLIKWKDSREPFWAKQNQQILSGMECIAQDLNDGPWDQQSMTLDNKDANTQCSDLDVLSSIYECPSIYEPQVSQVIHLGEMETSNVDYTN